jgi:DNA-binding SARP family transcriptional activator
MSSLRILLFGMPSIAHDNQVIAQVPRTMLSLLGYLLQQPRSYHRDLLADLFWPDYPQTRARNCLNTTLWRLRGLLEPAGTPRGTFLVTAPTGEVGFNWESNHWLDVMAFGTQLGRALSQPIHEMRAADAQVLESTLELYTGEFLAGVHADWVLEERERLRALYLDGLAHLLCYYQQNRAYEASLACGRRILQHDPLREDIHREMIRLYMEAGQRVSAIRQYETCRRLLAEEMGIQPMEETRVLYFQIVSTDARSQPLSSSPQAPVNLEQALDQLRQAKQALEHASKQVAQAAEVVERLTKPLD